MTQLHKLVNGVQAPLSEEEISAFQEDLVSWTSKTAREAELAPLKALYDMRKEAYGSVEKQLEILSEEGEQALRDRNAQIKLDYPITAELQAIKDSCSEEELLKVRG